MNYIFFRGADNKFELDFTSNLHDIINSEHQVLDMSATYRPVKEYQPEYRRSLRVSVFLQTIQIND